MVLLNAFVHNHTYTLQSPWNEYFENAELEKEIDQDVIRTYPELDYFKAQRVRDMLRRVLLVYARREPEVGYKQGMHELLAPMLYLYERQALSADEAAGVDATTRSDGVPSYAPLLAKRHVEADAFTSFAALMSASRDWFVAKPAAAGAPRSNAVVERCQHVQSNFLRSRDPELCAYLESLRVEPQLYMLRWLRCLFGREFELRPTLRIWDALFAFGESPLTLVDALCGAMLRHVRESLLLTDYSGALTILKAYPADADVDRLLRLAVQLHAGHAPAPRRAPSTTTTTVAASTAAASTTAATPINHHTTGNNSLSSSSNKLPPATAPPNAADVAQLVAVRLERICEALQSEMRADPEGLGSNENIMFILADLKQSRDTLAGRL
jgi:hypothetical protein